MRTDQSHDEIGNGSSTAELKMKIGDSTMTMKLQLNFGHEGGKRVQSEFVASIVICG